MKRSNTHTNAVSVVSAAVADLPAQNTWVRPADWLTTPILSDNDYKAFFLVAVSPQDAYFGLNISGSGHNGAGGIVVDWGDGTQSTSSASAGGSWERKLLYANLPAGSASSRGYRQQLITVTWPATATGVGVTGTKPSSALTGQPSQQSFGASVIELGIAGANLTTIGLSNFSYPYRMLERAAIYKNGCTNAPWFNYCDRLRSLPVCYTNNVTSFNNMFGECMLLDTIDAALNVSKATSMSSMFQSCQSLRALPTLTGFGTLAFDGSVMFNGCYSLQSIPAALSFSKCTNLTNTFASCYSLRALSVDLSNCTQANSMAQTCPQLATVTLTNAVKLLSASSALSGLTTLRSVTLPSFPVCTNLSSFLSNCLSLVTAPAIDAPVATAVQGLFNGCNVLRQIGDLNLPAATNASSMFASCPQLKTAPNITFGAGKLTNVSSMFNNCSGLTAAPNLDVSAVTTAQAMFQSCQVLQYVPAYNFSAACLSFDSMFSGCLSLQEVPAFNVSGATALGNMVNQCYQLTRFAATGMKASFGIPDTFLSVAGLTEVFNNLASGVSAKTITISGATGAAAGSGLDRTIATAKGWTVTG